jgi:MFS transporter, DHA1 family, tetracycline resistance protein
MGFSKSQAEVGRAYRSAAVVANTRAPLATAVAAEYDHAAMKPPLDPANAGSALQAVVLPSVFLLLAMVNLTLPVAGLEELVIGELGGDAKDAGLFFSIEMLAYILCAPLWGVLSDRLGQRRTLVATGFLASAGLYLCLGAVRSVEALLVLRFFQGAASVLGWSTLMAMVLDQPDQRRRGRMMGVMGGALSLGVALGAPLGGVVTSALGPRGPLRVAALIFAVLGLATFLLRERHETRPQVKLRQIASTLAGRPQLFLPCLFYFVDRYTVGFFVVLFPLYLGTLGVADPAVKGGYLSLFLLPFSLLQYWAGKLTERVGPWWPLLGGSAAYGLVLATVGFSGAFALWWVMVALGVLAAVMFPPTILLTAQLSDSATRGSAMGAFNLAGSLGFAVGPLVGAWAQARWGYGGAFVVAGALEVVAVALALFWLRRWPGARAPGVETPG